jgi:hypothetical protein
LAALGMAGERRRGRLVPMRNCGKANDSNMLF